MRQALLRQTVTLATLLLPSLGWADVSAWLGPQPPGGAYPAGEEDRQYAMLSHDLNHRDAFRRVAEQAFRREALVFDSDRDPLDVILRRSEVLLADIRRMPHAPDLNAPAAELADLRARAGRVHPTNQAARRAIFDEVCHVRRRIALGSLSCQYRTCPPCSSPCSSALSAPFYAEHRFPPKDWQPTKAQLARIAG